MKNIKDSVSPKAGLFLLIVFVLLMVIMFAFTSLFSSEGFSDAMAENSDVKDIHIHEKEKRLTIIIDAGHGGEDPGAVVGTLREKDINLILAQKLETLFSIGDYNVVLTRTGDNLLYNNGEENNKKQYDLKNRADIAEMYENAVFVSIHMNKFYLTSCKGAQVFHSESELSLSLAESIQNSVKLLQADNERKPKNGSSTVYLLGRLKCPAVLVECGFLSNAEDAASLSDEEYTDKLSVLIYKGIIEWIYENETNLCLR